MATSTGTKKRTSRARAMSDSHKAALAKGREEGRVVRVYLEAIESAKPRRGRRRTADSIRKRLSAIEKEIATSSPLNRLRFVQEQRDLKAELKQAHQPVDLSSLEKNFVRVAKSYSTRKGYWYSTWRTVGVSAQVLSKAGIARTRG